MDQCAQFVIFVAHFINFDGLLEAARFLEECARPGKRYVARETEYNRYASLLVCHLTRFHKSTNANAARWIAYCAARLSEGGIAAVDAVFAGLDEIAAGKVGIFAIVEQHHHGELRLRGG